MGLDSFDLPLGHNDSVSWSSRPIALPDIVTRSRCVVPILFFIYISQPRLLCRSTLIITALALMVKVEESLCFSSISGQSVTEPRAVPIRKLHIDTKRACTIEIKQMKFLH